ncbi:MAG: cache domain-containing protein, partial [Treponema sp.]|nr:cache domain-containing protein [Treponema sp.]
MKLGTIIRKEFLQLFFVVLSFTLMIVVSYHYVSGIVEKQIFSNAEETLNTAEVTIHSDFREAETVLYHSSLFVEQLLERGESTKVIKAYITQVSDILNDNDGEIPGFINTNSKFLNIMISCIEWLSPDNSGEQHISWQQAAQAANGGLGYTLPYTDSDTGKQVITLAKILRDRHGEEHGIIGLNLDFTLLSNYIESLYANEGGYGMLCD